MLLTKRELPVLAVNLVYLPAFTVVALGRRNYEFVMYALVVLAVALLVLWQQRRVRFGLTILWGLTGWGLLHMAGGNIRVGDGVLYGVILAPIWPALDILRYDQVVHTFGFGVATLVCYHVLRPYLRTLQSPTFGLCVLIVMMGSGVGAMNEIIEFIAVLVMPETNVGGYQNTMIDLCANLLGGILAMALVLLREPRTRQA